MLSDHQTKLTVQAVVSKPAERYNLSSSAVYVEVPPQLESAQLGGVQEVSSSDTKSRPLGSFVGVAALS